MPDLLHTIRLLLLALLPLTAPTALLGMTESAEAVDLVIQDVEFTQAIQNDAGDIPLVSGRETLVRVLVRDLDGEVPVPDVEVELIWDGNDVPPYGQTQPMAVTNDLVPNQFDDTFNFCINEQGSVASFTITVDPNNTIAETDESNNVLTLSRSFVCRSAPRVGYTRTDYAPVGTVSSSFVAPGTGDISLHATLPTPDVDYFELPVLAVAQSIDDEGGLASDPDAIELLRQLNQCTQILNEINSAPEDQVDTVYAWLPGSLSGNGLAWIGKPGALGNTEGSRYQRTLTHEFMHNLGLDHPECSQLLNYGADVRDLFGFTNPIRPIGMDGIICGGNLTNQAWINAYEYEYILSLLDFVCLTVRAGAPQADVFAVSGFAGGPAGFTLEEVYLLDSATPTPDDPAGLLIARVLRDDGMGGEEILHEIRFSPSPTPDCIGCDSPISILLPAVVDGMTADRIAIVDPGTGNELASSAASNNAPVAEFTAHDPAADISEGELIPWSATDADGDPLDSMLYWSWNNGVNWVPLTLDSSLTQIVLNTEAMPGAPDGTGVLRLYVSDGFHTAKTEIGGLTLDTDHAPELSILTPSDGAITDGATLLHLSCVCSDLEDFGGLFDSSIEWYSDIDGFLGIGRKLVASGLSEGNHTIYADCFDSDGNMTTATVDVIVTNDPDGDSGMCCASGVELNEIRPDHFAADNQEYIELIGDPGTNMDCMRYLAVGPGGVVEEIVSFSGQTMGSSGLFLVAEATFNPSLFMGMPTPDLTTDLNFLNGGNRTHLLVCSCDGLPGVIKGTDLDTNNDGTFDSTPWDCVVDCLALVGDPSAAPVYCVEQLGPTATENTPTHAFRCQEMGGGTPWKIGAFQLPSGGGADTPGTSNPPCRMPTRFDGLLHRVRNDAVLGLNNAGDLIVHTVGPSGEAGYRAVVDGWDSYGIEFDAAALSLQDGDVFDVETRGVLDGVPDVLRTRIRVQQKCLGPQDEPRFEVFADLSAYDPDIVEVLLYDQDGVLLDDQSFVPNPDTALACFGPDTCEIYTDYEETVDGVQVIDTALIFPSPVSVTLGPTSGDCVCSETAFVTEIRIRAKDISADPGPLRAVDVTPFQGVQLPVFRAAAGLFGNAHTGIGDVSLSVVPEDIDVSILIEQGKQNTEPYGVTFDTDPVENGFVESGFEIGLELPLVNEVAENVVSMELLGETVAEVTLTDLNGSFMVGVDFTNVLFALDPSIERRYIVDDQVVVDDTVPTLSTSLTGVSTITPGPEVNVYVSAEFTKVGNELVIHVTTNYVDITANPPQAYEYTIRGPCPPGEFPSWRNVRAETLIDPAYDQAEIIDEVVFFLEGPICPADIAGSGGDEPDGLVNVLDLLKLLAGWGEDGDGADLAEPNDVIDVLDLLAMLAAWGGCN